MSTVDIVLWVLVAITTINAIVLSRWITGVNRYLKNKVGYGAVIWVAVTGLIGFAAWTYLAFALGYVQLFLWVALPALVRMGALAAEK